MSSPSRSVRSPTWLESTPSTRFSAGMRTFVIILPEAGARTPRPWAVKIAPTVIVTDLITSMCGRRQILMTLMVSL
jgi:hypothetical protein